MLNPSLILIGKIIISISKALNIGSGSTWPGHIAMETNPSFLKQVLKNNPTLKIILVAGTNGKTTTSLMLQKILEKNGLKVFRNEAGANLLNGMASTIIKNSNLTGKLNFNTAIFEVDERNLSLALKEMNPYAILLLNIFRDQLDRYGEVNQVITDWKNALSQVQDSTLLFTNGDDPALSFLGRNLKVKSYYFGVDEKYMNQKTTGYDVDFTYCPACQNKLSYKKVSFSHMGDFICSSCDFKKGKIENTNIEHYPLLGTYNIYNANAAALTARKGFDISLEKINNALKFFAPAFGRQEEITYRNKKILMLLSKNPAGFNQSIDAVKSFGKGNFLLVLNDKIPDGTDVSWIWDVDFDNLPKNSKIFISGDRAYDMGLRIKYSTLSDFKIIENLKDAIDRATGETPTNETLYILPTYSAMLEARKVLTGKKIL